SLKPSCTSRSKKRRLRAVSIGLTSAWFPSRRSVEHQIGAAVRTTSGQARSCRSTVSYGRYLQCGIGTAGSFGGGTHVSLGRERVCRRASPLPGETEQEHAETEPVQDGRIGQRCHGTKPRPGPRRGRVQTGQLVRGIARERC